ncbi:hypothetical protein BX666DRAFT_2022689 [Dichotomocladium elegans]|nr:hypothetical protein BX666DRAFT_2022689 [Dichotomocladium elegans]
MKVANDELGNPEPMGYVVDQQEYVVKSITSGVRRDEIQPVLMLYSKVYQFRQQSIYYDPMGAFSRPLLGLKRTNNKRPSYGAKYRGVKEEI